MGRHALAAALVGLAVAGCASVPVAPASDSSRSAAVRIVTVDDLRTDAGWTFEPGPNPAPDGIVSADEALEAVTGNVRGYSPTAALVYVTATASGPQRLHHTLAWVVEVRGVPIAPVPPYRSTVRGTVRGTAQWVIDAMTGQYIRARDF